MRLQRVRNDLGAKHHHQHLNKRKISAQNSDHKDAHWPCKKNTWRQWELQQRENIRNCLYVSVKRDITEVKNTISELKSTLDGFNSRLFLFQWWSKKRISDLQYRSRRHLNRRGKEKKRKQRELEWPMLIVNQSD